MKIGSGATPRGGKDVYHERGVAALIRSQNIYNDRFDRSGLVYLLPEHAEQLKNVEVQQEDVLLNITGDSVARVCQVPNDVLPARVNQHVAIIRPDPKKLHSRFLRFFLASPQIQAHMLGLAAAGATRNALTKGMIEGFTIPPIPLHKQKIIAELLGALEDKIDLNRRTNETLEAMARLFFKDWFVDFGPTRAKTEGCSPYLAPELWSLFPDTLDDEDKPVGWNIESLGNHMVNFDSKRVPVASDERAMRKGVYPYHGATSVMDYIDNYLFDGTYLLIGEDGSVVQKNGMAFTQYVSGKIWVNNHAHVLQGKGAVTTEQLYMYFHFETVAPYVTGAVQLKLSQGRMNLMPFMFPGDKVCHAFGNVVNPLFAQLRTNIDENKTLAETRDLLLPKLMSGEISFRDAEKLVNVL
ncbi:MAG: restriction endonuclease subunit S [Limisphaerales bacterium]